MDTTPVPDLGFGFNNPKFSDKIIRIVIVPDDDSSMISKPDPINDDAPESPALSSSTTRKRLRSSLESPSKGDEASASSEIHQEKCIHANSLILASQSAFFLKLFSNGMKESDEQHVTLHIRASEEDSVMELLKFIYSGTLSSDTPWALLDLMMAADKFEVVSCIKLCGKLLLELPMTLESAVRYLDLASTSPVTDAVRPLTDAATKFIVEHFKDLKKAELQKELLELPFVGVGVVFSSDCLQVESEDDIYDFMLNWVQTRYSDQLEERRTIMNTLVQKFLRFPFLSNKTLESIRTCSDIDPAVASELALRALSYLKPQGPQPPHQQTPNIFRKRAYTRLPLKAVVCDSSSSHHHCVIYLDLKRDECKSISPGGVITSQYFFLGEHQLALCVSWRNTNRCCLHFVRAQASELALCFFCEVRSREKPSEEFAYLMAGNINIMTEQTISDYWDIFGIPWTRLISKDNDYFINDALRLRFDLSVKI